MSLPEIPDKCVTRSRWTAFFTGLAATAGGVVLTLGAWSLSREVRTQEQRLPDGTRISLVGATNGKRHETAIGTGWQRLWLGLFPHRPLGGEVLTHITSPGMLVVWWRLDVSKGRTNWANSHYQAAFDEHGCRFGKSHAEAKLFRAKTLDQVFAQELPVYPRRSPTVTVGFFHQRTRRLTAKLVVPNPGPRVHPEWKAELYPIRKQSGSLELTLHRLSHRPIRIEQGSAGRFSITENGRATDRWDPVNLTAEDATGNRTFTPLPRLESGEVTWFNGLCTHEKAWKLGLELAPAYPLRVPPDFTWKIRDIPVPASGKLALRTDRIVNGGGSLFFQGLADLPNRFDAETRRTMQYLQARVRMQTPSGLCLTLVKVTDERGQDLSSGAQGGVFARMEGGARQVYRPSVPDYSFNLRLPRGLKCLNLTFAVHRTHRFEFLAKP